MNWRVLFTQGLFWLATEMLLNPSGLDRLADYGEYILSQQFTHSLAAVTIVQPADLFGFKSTEKPL